jgi:hypothetical protein
MNKGQRVYSSCLSLMSCSWGESLFPGWWSCTKRVIAPATEAVFHPSWKYAGEQEVAGGAARQRWPDCGGALQDGVGVWRLGTWRRWPAAICRVGRRTWLDAGTAAALVSTKLPDLQFLRLSLPDSRSAPLSLPPPAAPTRFLPIAPSSAVLVFESKPRARETRSTEI